MKLAGMWKKNLAMLLAIGLVGADVARAEPRKDEFVSMFDGKSLQGWSVMPAKAREAWSVQQGMIIGEGDKGRSYLVFDQRQLADFELRFEYRFPGEGNSGVSIRARVDETGTRGFQSYHADLGHVGIGKQVLGAWDFHTPGRREHACFRGDRLVIDEKDEPTVTAIEDAVTLDDIRAGDWNQVLVRAEGNRFQLFLNGKLSSEFVEHLPPERRLDRGMIQLQLHDPGMVVHFRELAIKVLR